MKRERLEKGEADREDRLLQEQIERAKQEALEKQMDAVYENAYMKMEDDLSVKEDGSPEPETEMKDVKTVDDDATVNIEDSETPATPILVIHKPLKMSAPAPITLKKPLNPLKSSNPLASKKSPNPLKSAMKEVRKEESLPPVNYNGKRPLPKAVEIMQEEQRLKRIREERYNRDHRDDRHRDHKGHYRNEMSVDSR
jgi:hypothetical protein